jgi:prepilin-type processing-associated H-X9-DG protein
MSKHRRRAASLVEVLVTIGLIGVLAGLLLPAVQSARQSAGRSRCQNNLRQIGLALHDYHGNFGHFPVDAKSNLSWMVSILPYLERESLYDTSVAAASVNPNPLVNPPHVGLNTVVTTYVCPDDSRLTSSLTDPFGVNAAFTSYIGNGGAFPKGATVGLEGIFGDPSGVRFADITDGTSQTLLVGERTPPGNLQAGWWYPGFAFYGFVFRGPNVLLLAGAGTEFVDDPACIDVVGTFSPGRLDNPCDRYHYWSLHPGGANFLFADGSTRFLSYAAEPLIIPLSSRSGGEAISLP